MLRMILTLIIVSTCVAAGPEPVRPDAKIDLSPNLKEGREFHITWSWKMEDTWFEMGESTSDEHLGMRQVMGWLFNVKDVEEDGKVKMQLTWSRLGIEIDWGETKIGYDSLAHDPRNPLAVVCAPVIGEKVTFFINRKGEVSNVTGMEAIRKRIEQFQPNEGLYSIVKPMLDDESLAFLLKQYFAYYAWKEVKLGSTWKRIIESEESTCEFEFKVTGINLNVGRPTVTVEYEAKHVPPKSREESERDVKEFELEGSLVFDARSLELIECNEEEEMVVIETTTATETEPSRQMRVVHTGEQVVTNDPPVIKTPSLRPADRK